MKKIIAMTLAAVICLGFMLTGCGKDSENKENSAQTATETKVVRTCIASEPDNLDPWKSAAADTEAVMNNVFEGLVSFNEKGQYIPCIAEKWEISPDGLVYTYSIRDDVFFHNGQKLTMDDIIYSYNAYTGLGGEEPVKAKFDIVSSIEAVDESTFKITLKEKSSPFLGFTTAPILPKDYKEQESKPIGTGPFEFSEYIPGQKLVLKKNENYYNSEKAAKIDSVEIYVMSDYSAIVSALKSNQLDLAMILPDNIPTLKNDFDIMTSPQNMVQILGLNNNAEPFNNKDVRKALCYAVDKDEIIAGAFDGYGTKIYSNFSPVLADYYNGELENIYTKDLDKAKELLKKAGYENGFDMTITVPGNYVQHVDTAQILAQQLKPLGINVEIETIEWATWLDRVYKKADYQATVIGFGGKLNVNDILIRYTTGYRKNFINFSDERYDSDIAEAAKETDDAKLQELYKDAQKVLTEEAASVYICDPNLTIASAKNLKGYTFYPMVFHDFSKLYFE